MDVMATDLGEPDNGRLGVDLHGLAPLCPLPPPLPSPLLRAVPTAATLVAGCVTVSLQQESRHCGNLVSRRHIKQ